jgi:Uma2 family endonuclease
MASRQRFELENGPKPVSEAAFERLSLGEPGQWELHDGYAYRKPPITLAHNDLAWQLGLTLGTQLSRDEWVIRVDAGLVRRSASRYYIPDVMVVSRQEARALFPDPHTWEVYPGPIALVVEVWSPSTGVIDQTEKLSEYKRRGDAEIWLLHPIERSLTVWRRLPDGSYDESVFRRGIVHPASVPGASIDLDELFRVLDS